MATTWNEHLPLLPHRDGEWKEHGVIVGELPDVPKLFKLNGHDMLTWKELDDRN